MQKLFSFYLNIFSNMVKCDINLSEPETTYDNLSKCKK